MSGLPSKFDLRDVDGKNFVSPVKLQNPWGTCWSFGATAAAETSLAYEYGYDYYSSDYNPEFDLSELHLAWFSRTGMPANSMDFPSQAGEGFHVHAEEGDDPSDITRKTLNTGGYMNFATTIYSAGMGPVLELTVPYQASSDVVYSKYTLTAMTIDPKGYIDTDSVVQELIDADKITKDEIIKEWETKGYEYVDGFTMMELTGFAQTGEYDPITKPDSML